MSHGDTDGEPGIDGIARSPIEIEIDLESTGSPTIPARMTTAEAWRVCRVCVPLLKRTGSAEAEAAASDRVPRFSRFRLADSIRFVRFNMAKPSHPPTWGGRKV
jgi:hypothetical protein